MFCTVVLVPLAAGRGEFSPEPYPLAPLRSASEIDYPPFCLVDAEGEAGGFSVELMRAAVRAMGRDVVFQTGPWTHVRQLLESGQVEALPLVGRTPEREAFYDFTVPYLTMHGAIVVHADSTGIQTLDDLRGRSVAVMQGDNAEEFLRREDRGIEIHATSTFVEALRAVEEGRHDAVVVQRLVALRIFQEEGFRDLRILPGPVPGFRQDFCFAVRKGDHSLLSLLNEGLSLVVADGTYRRLHTQWFASLELPTHRRAVIVGETHYPPFQFLDARGRPRGFVVDLTRAIAREMGLDVDLRLLPWHQAVRALQQGEVDGIQGMIYTPERAEGATFSPPFLTLHYAGIVRKGEERPPTSLADLEGRDLVLQKGDRFHAYLLQHFPGARVTTVESQEDALRAVVLGLHEATVLIRSCALHLIERNGWDTLRVGGESLLSGDYCYAFSREHQALAATFSEGLQFLKTTGEYQRIYNQWLGVYEQDRMSRRDVLRYAWMVLVPLLLVLAASLGTAGILRHRVSQRTADLAASEDRYRNLFEHNPNQILLLDPDTGGIVGANPAAETYYGGAGNDLCRLNLAEINGEPSEQNLVWLASALEGSCRYRTASHRRADGEMRDVELFLGPISVAGRVLVCATLHDITERRKAEAHVQRLMRVLRTIRGINQLIIGESDRHRLIAQACDMLVENRSYEGAKIFLIDSRSGKVCDYARSSLGEEDPRSTSFFHALEEQETPPPCCAVTTDAVRLMNAETSCAGCPTPLEERSESSLSVRISHGATTFGFLVIRIKPDSRLDSDELLLLRELAQDLGHALQTLDSNAERETMQRQLLQSQKVESIGRLAGGVAHDFNNMLMGIMGYAELCKEELPEGHPGQELLDQVLVCSKRSASLTRQLLAFARRQTIDPRNLDLNETVSEMLKLLQRLIGEHIHLVWKPCTEGCLVRMDPAQVDQILANLCVNARDAIQGSGKLTIETRLADIAEDTVLEHPEARPGRYVILSVNDDGCGMDRNTLDHIFEPFYTTKRTGEGTGLGLATVYGIVRQNQGFINVYSEPGQGTTFRLYLPRTTERPDQETHDAPAKPPGGSETLLLVEDEPSVLAAARHFLEEGGYQVLAVSSPSMALQVAGGHSGMIHLLLSDVVMPGLSGKDLARTLVETRPDLKTLYMSGYTVNVIAHHGILDKDVAFLSKPFGREDLLRKVREVLDR